MAQSLMPRLKINGCIQPGETRRQAGYDQNNQWNDGYIYANGIVYYSHLVPDRLFGGLQQNYKIIERLKK
jgi:hypothetical protein